MLDDIGNSSYSNASAGTSNPAHDKSATVNAHAIGSRHADCSYADTANNSLGIDQGNTDSSNTGISSTAVADDRSSSASSCFSTGDTTHHASDEQTVRTKAICAHASADGSVADAPLSTQPLSVPVTNNLLSANAGGSIVRSLTNSGVNTPVGSNIETAGRAARRATVASLASIDLDSATQSPSFADNCATGGVASTATPNTQGSSVDTPCVTLALPSLPSSPIMPSPPLLPLSLSVAAVTESTPAATTATTATTALPRAGSSSCHVNYTDDGNAGDGDSVSTEAGDDEERTSGCGCGCGCACGCLRETASDAALECDCDCESGTKNAVDAASKATNACSRLKEQQHQQQQLQRQGQLKRHYREDYNGCNNDTDACNSNDDFSNTSTDSSSAVHSPSSAVRTLAHNATVSVPALQNNSGLADGVFTGAGYSDDALCIINSVLSSYVKKNNHNYIDLNMSVHSNANSSANNTTHSNNISIKNEGLDVQSETVGACDGNSD